MATDPSLAQYYGAAMDGVDLSGVARIQTPVPGNSSAFELCSGTRIGLRAVLTAAHCVTDSNTGALVQTANQTTARFVVPGGGFQTFTTSAVFVQPAWRGFDNPGTALYQDVAVLLFSAPLPGSFATYGLFDNGALGSQTATGSDAVLSGYGAFGNGLGSAGLDGRRRAGNNVVDLVDDDPSSQTFGDLFTSFEDANNGFNSVCGFYGANSSFCHPSRGATEAGTGAGDSGGPLFINGLLAGVTSFSTYLCDPSVVDACAPYMVADANRPLDSYGSLSGFAPASANLAFIRAAVNVPEPSTVYLLGLGVTGLAAVARRRQS